MKPYAIGDEIRWRTAPMGLRVGKVVDLFRPGEGPVLGYYVSQDRSTFGIGNGATSGPVLISVSDIVEPDEQSTQAMTLAELNEVDQ